MRCPYCGFAESKVIDSRPTEESNSIRRRRECLKCQKRFTTYEKLEAISLAVIKKDQSRQQYDRGKVLKGIITACEKRPISLSQMEQIADDIEDGDGQHQELDGVEGLLHRRLGALLVEAGPDKAAGDGAHDHDRGDGQVEHPEAGGEGHGGQLGDLREEDGHQGAHRGRLGVKGEQVDDEGHVDGPAADAQEGGADLSLIHI